MFYPEESKSLVMRLLPLLLVVSVILLGCAGPGHQIPQSDYLFQNKNEFVRLESIETGAASNQHPYRISAEKLTEKLIVLKATGNGKFAMTGEANVFTEDQAARLGRDLSTALLKARPDQDVTFQSGGKSGIFGDYSRPSYTTGRMFVSEGRTHLILGVMQELPDIDDTRFYTPFGIFYPIGTRSQRVERDWDLQPGAGRLEEQRADWLSFALDSDSASSIQDFPSGSPEQPESDEARAIEQRLQVLENLKVKGLITEQEYRDKRQQILDDF